MQWPKEEALDLSGEDVRRAAGPHVYSSASMAQSRL